MVRIKGVARGRLMAGVLLLAGMAVVAGCDINHDVPVNGAGGTPTLMVSKNHLEFLLDQDSSTSDAALFQTLELQSNDGTLVKWAIVTDTPWVFINQTEGQTSSEQDNVDIGIVMNKFTPGLYRGSLTIAEQTDTNSSVQVVTITVRICEGVCIFVNPTNLSHKITSLLFGSQSEYLNSGTGIWDSITTGYCTDPSIPEGRPHQAMLDEFLQLGIGFLRYPSGIPSDFFHWNEAIGPVVSRRPQINPWVSSYDDVLTECPVFGPDEFVQYAKLLDVPMLITTNAGNGTAQEAADWLGYYEDKGVSVEYWEVGNEIYIEGVAYLFSTYMQPMEYAAAFDAQAEALRLVNPDIKVGAVMSPMDQEWNRGVMATIREPFDFITVHSFQPQIDTCNEPSDEEVYHSLLASPLLMETQLQLIKESARDLAVLPNKTPIFSITEWGPWFLHVCGPGAVANNDARGRTMASALFSGLVWNTMMREPSIFSAFHSALSSSKAQATVNIVFRDGVWVPIRSGYNFVQKLYSESAGGMVIPTLTRNSPTFTAKLFDLTERVELPELDSVAVLSEDNSRLYVYIANRSLTEDIDFQLLIGDLPSAVTSVVAETVVANSFRDENTAERPNAIGVVNTVLETKDELRLTLMAHTLVRVTFSMANSP